MVSGVSGDWGLAIVDIFSKRQKRIRGEVPDVFKYDELPESFRVQVIHIWEDIIGSVTRIEAARTYSFIAKDLCKEYGVFKLPSKSRTDNRFEELANFLLQETDVERVIDAIELSFRVVWLKAEYGNRLERKRNAIDELNQRFKEHGIGFQFVDGRVIRVDTEYVHENVVRPALQLLHQKRYAGAQEEFLSAHQHYRKGRTKEALNDCLKAFESVMKTICDRRKWSYAKGASAKSLIDTCLQNELIPTFWQSHFSSLKSLMESGIPAGRNRLSGHGQGPVPVAVPDHIASYMLHLTAAAIVFLAEADAQLR